MTINQAYLSLLLLLAFTVAFSFLPWPHAGPLLALLIAGLKAIIIGLIFMKLGRGSATLKFVACAALMWIFFLGLLTATDYLTRSPDALPALSEGIHP